MQFIKKSGNGAGGGVADNIYSGLVTAPTFTDNGNGTGTFGSCTVNLFSTTGFTGAVKTYTVAGGTFTFTAGAEEYVAINYNSGSPIMYKETTESNINGSNIILVRIVWRINNLDTTITLHSLDTDLGGLGLPMKSNQATWKSQPYRRSTHGGLVITESATPNPRTVIVTGADVYTSSFLQVVAAYNSSTDTLTHAYHVGGVWTYDTGTHVYNNLYYDNGTALVQPSANKWMTRWFYRSIGDAKDVFYVNGSTYYNTKADADLEGQRSDLPGIILDHCVLVGKSLIEVSTTNGSMESLFEASVIGLPVINHNDTQNIQGGTTNEYYHLTSTQYGNVGFWNAAVSTLANLPSVGNTTGEKRVVLDTGITYRWTGYAWIQDGYTTPGALTIPLGNWNATTNSPTITSGVGNAGEWYYVSVAGTTTIDGISVWGVGDYIWYDGAVWQKIDNQTPVNYQTQINTLYGFAVAMGAAL